MSTVARSIGEGLDGTGGRFRVQTGQAHADGLRVTRRIWDGLGRDGALQLTPRRVGTVVLKAVGGVVAFLVLGNVAILAASFWAQETTSVSKPQHVDGVENLRAVDDRLWRGAAPTTEGYRNLSLAGITTVVDLRAEDGIAADAETVEGLGMNMIRI